MTSWDEFVAHWRPPQAWKSTINGAAATIERNPAGTDALDAWCQVAMMLGDTGAAPLALLVCLHAEMVAAPEANLSALHAHRDVCLFQLGLGHDARAGPIRIADLGAPGRVAAHETELRAWLAGQLTPFDGDLARAASAILALALAQTLKPARS